MLASNVRGHYLRRDGLQVIVIDNLSGDEVVLHPLHPQIPDQFGAGPPESPLLTLLHGHRAWGSGQVRSQGHRCTGQPVRPQGLQHMRSTPPSAPAGQVRSHGHRWTGQLVRLQRLQHMRSTCPVRSGHLITTVTTGHTLHADWSDCCVATKSNILQDTSPKISKSQSYLKMK